MYVIGATMGLSLRFLWWTRPLDGQLVTATEGPGFGLFRVTYLVDTLLASVLIPFVLGQFFRGTVWLSRRMSSVEHR